MNLIEIGLWLFSTISTGLIVYASLLLVATELEIMNHYPWSVQETTREKINYVLDWCFIIYLVMLSIYIIPLIYFGTNRLIEYVLH